MGALNAVYPAYQPVASEDNKEKFKKAWQAALELSVKPGLTIVESLNGVLDGTVKALYIMGENPIISDPNQHHVIEAMEKVEFLIVQDIMLTETAQYADVVLPGLAFLEKEGTVSNTERRVQMMHCVVAPAGDSRDDWWIIMEIARRMGVAWNYRNAKDIFEEIRAVTPSYAGITYERLEKELIQWPCINTEHPGTQYLHRDKFSRGMGLLSAIEFTPPAEDVDPEYPMILTTGRILEHFHTGTMSRNSIVLTNIINEAFVEINPIDASNYNITDGEIISVSTRRGSLRIKAKVSLKPKANVVFIPFHFAEAAANKLTIDALDPTCKIPELKVCACKIEKVNA
jgi:predicted molibdopterin-dependent oxidoreductase YjgC